LRLIATTRPLKWQLLVRHVLVLVVPWVGWRVSFYGYFALGTDCHPPFSLGEVPATRPR
jgi:hypothetical protein